MRSLLSVRFVSSGASTKINREMLAKLRSETGYPIINCKQALQISEYDYDKALVHLTEIARQKGLDKLQNTTRNMSQGLIALYSNKTSAAFVEVNCETDFVAKTELFQSLAKSAASTLLQNYSSSTRSSQDHLSKLNVEVEDLNKMQISKSKQTIEESLQLAAGKLREKIGIRRALLFSSPPDHFLGTYVHPSVLVTSSTPSLKLGVFASAVSFKPSEGGCISPSSNFQALIGRNLAQHIVGMNSKEIGDEPEMKLVNSERYRLTGELEEMNSTEENGLIERRFPVSNSRQLLKQEFLFDNTISVAEWLRHKKVEVFDFVRFRVGESDLV